MTSAPGRHEAMRIAGERVDNARRIEARNPWDGSLVGTVPKATVADVRRAFTAAREFTARLTRHERSAILARAAERLRTRIDEVSDLITAESGLCKDTIYEVGRACDVLRR
jgi:aldehyde dehydrogenase (NAD+)